MPDDWTSAGEEVILGDFESGLDGWSATGDVELETVSASDRPGGVTRGNGALDVEIDGDAYPLVERTVASADLVAHPYLIADVAPGLASGTTSELTFAFRLYYGPDRDPNDPPEPQLSSPELTVPATLPSSLYWDLSAVDDRKLDEASRLELVWYSTKNPPSGDPRGPTSGFDYRGHVTVDNVRLSDRIHDLSVAKLAMDLRELVDQHGRVVYTGIESESETAQDGWLAFRDGTSVGYTFEVIEEHRFQLTVDDEKYQF